jgi:hypothetical protein
MSTKDRFIAMCPHCRLSFRSVDADGLAYFLRGHVKRVHGMTMSEDQSLEIVKLIKLEAAA